MDRISGQIEMLTRPVLLLCEYPQGASLEPACGWVLPDIDDQQRLQHFSKTSARTQFALSRLLLAQAMPVFLGNVGVGCKLSAHSSGQPLLCLADGREVSLSISHTPGLVAIVLAPASVLVGVDVEAWTRPVRLARLLEASMSVQDAAWCERQSSPEQGFIRHWTLKEAYLKSLGKGIAADLPALSFTLEGKAIGLRTTPYTDNHYWYFEQLSLLSDYCISLAYAAEEPVRACWQEVLGADSFALPGCQVRLLQLC